jgi:hypothetical protein
MPPTCRFCTPADAGELRKELADIYTRDMLMPSMHRRARRIIDKLARATGLSRDEVIANAMKDAEHLTLTPEAVA